jgi:UDP-N-acetylmuramate--alanine ligase
MSAIAHVLLERGHSVSGSDLQDGPALRTLAREGARVFVGHDGGQVRGADVVATTSAAPPDNPEIVETHRLGLPLWQRGELLRHLIGDQRCLAVAGIHGKTTTTAMLTLLLRTAGLEPSFIIGGVIPELGGSGHAGGGERFVVEADEYDRTFLSLRPTVAVVTNVEWEHVDCYPDEDAIVQAFVEFVGLVPPEGAVFVCQDDAGARGLPRAAAPIVGYGFSPEAEWRATDLRLCPQGTSFIVLQDGQPVGRFRLRIPGKHNVLNALAALAVVSREGGDIETAGTVLTTFSGAKRRFQQLGSARGIIVVDDYAHHPSEVRATLSAARQQFPERNLVAVFQPHTYSRTRAFGAAFAEALSLADQVLVTGIYAAREIDPGDLSGADVAAQVSGSAVYRESLQESLSWLLDHLEPGDVLLTLGAGDITLLGPQLMSCLLEQGV